MTTCQPSDSQNPYDAITKVIHQLQSAICPFRGIANVFFVLIWLFSAFFTKIINLGRSN